MPPQSLFATGSFRFKESHSEGWWFRGDGGSSMVITWLWWLSLSWPSWYCVLQYGTSLAWPGQARAPSGGKSQRVQPGCLMDSLLSTPPGFSVQFFFLSLPTLSRWRLFLKHSVGSSLIPGETVSFHFLAHLQKPLERNTGPKNDPLKTGRVRSVFNGDVFCAKWYRLSFICRARTWELGECFYVDFPRKSFILKPKLPPNRQKNTWISCWKMCDFV